jgi:hypothetical protein
VGSGGSQEAPYALKAIVPAGTYHLVLDAVIIGPVDVTFDLIWRHASGAADTSIASWTDHFTPLPGAVYDAQPFEYDESNCPAIETATGDQLVFRYTGANTNVTEAYIPNGDGPNSNGRIPSIALPN